MPNGKIIFIERKFPSSNMVIIKDEKPFVIDTGFGSDACETKKIIEDTGINLSDLSLIVNTHYHTDHVGGNHFLQKNYGTKIAAHKWDAKIINNLDPEAGCSDYLDQKLEPYRVDILLDDGDELHSGNKTFQVLHTPGHTLGHISLYEPTEQILIVGDLFHRDDVGWINIFREGVGAIYRSLESLERIRKLPIKVAYSGHGPKIEDPQRSIDQAIARYNRWIDNPKSIGWHGLKRVFAYTLMIKNGIHRNEIQNYLLSCSWFCDISQHIFRTEPKQFVEPLIDEMIRSQAANWHGNLFLATTPYNIPDSTWMKQEIRPINWQNET